MTSIYKQTELKSTISNAVYIFGAKISFFFNFDSLVIAFLSLISINSKFVQSFGIFRLNVVRELLILRDIL